MAQFGNVAQEYLVSLGVDVDKQGFSQMQRVLSSTKTTLLGITGVMTAMVVGMAKASASITQQAQKYEDMAKASKKSAESIAAQEIALKVMGKTLQEINKNERLKKIYDDLKSVGESMAFPQAGEGRKIMEGFTLESQRMKATLMYAFHWINREFLERIAAPLDELRQNLADLRKKISIQMPKLSATVGGAFGDFMRLIMAGAKGLSDLGQLIANLPSGVLKMLGAFSGLWGVLNANPLFIILSGLSAIMALLDDFYTYKRGGDSLLGDIWAGFEDGTALQKVTKGLNDALNGIQEKYEQFFAEGKTLAHNLLNGLFGFDFSDAGEQIGKFINQLYKAIGSMLNNPDMLDTVGDLAASAGVLIGGLLSSLGSAMSTIDYEGIGAQLGTFANSFMTKVGDVFNKIANGDGSGSNGVLHGAFEAAKGIGKSFIDTLAGVFSTLDGKEIAASLGGMVRSLFEGLTKQLETIKPSDAAEVGKKIADAISGAIKFTVNVVGSLAQQLLDGFSDGGAVQKFIEVGGQIATYISRGIVHGLSDTVYKLLFGEEAMAKEQKYRNKAYEYDDNKLIGYDSASGKYISAERMGDLAYNPLYENRDLFDSSELGSSQNKNLNKELSNAVRQFWYESDISWDNLDNWTAKANDRKEEQYISSLNAMLKKAQGAAESQDLDAFKVYSGKAQEIQAAIKGDGDIKGKIKQIEEESQIALSVDQGGTISNMKNAVTSALKDVQASLPPIEIKTKVSGVDTPKDGLKNSAGGRYDRFAHTTIAESGEPEYIIPIKRPERAKGLILQMLSEMGSGARDILQSFGIDGGGSVPTMNSGIDRRLAMASAYPSFGDGSVKSNSDNNITSSPNIVIYSNDPVVAGQTAARESERVLLKHIRGAYGV